MIYKLPDGNEADCPCTSCLVTNDGYLDRRITYLGEKVIWWMVICPICGNKRCPHAENHRNECTGTKEEQD